MNSFFQTLWRHFWLEKQALSGVEKFAAPCREHFTLSYSYIETSAKRRPLDQLVKETKGFFLWNTHLAFGHMS